jgi:hypothetical protein
MFDVNYITASSSVSGSLVWIIVSLVVAILGGIALYFIFTSKEFEPKLKGFVKTLSEYLTFEKGIIRPLLKITYLILMLYITLSSFALIRYSFLSFLITLILGNLVLRIIFEFSIIMLELANDVKAIRKKK